MLRMNFLNTVERESFDSPPVFNSLQRKQYFDFPSKLRCIAETLRNQRGRSRTNDPASQPRALRILQQAAAKLPWGHHMFSWTG
jgi:hypothetical protein